MLKKWEIKMSKVFSNSVKTPLFRFQISPFPYDLIKAECAKYPNAQLSWTQEEHKNQGAWTYVQPRFETTLNGTRDVV